MDNLWNDILQGALQIGGVLVLAGIVEARAFLHRMIRSWLEKVELEKYSIKEERAQVILDRLVDSAVNVVEEKVYQYSKEGKPLDFDKLEKAKDLVMTAFNKKDLKLPDFKLDANDLEDLINEKVSKLRRFKLKDIL